ncbi:chromosome segregation protein SMC [uncultured Ruminococcus sp.]|uniref:chromosome segregation protein SMC n=1 Tax=uncultured Ruminococcus sp. TaxID=165186 RepID=UPI00292E3BDF|nr:chromosome segregation protein SMC [uncultured Ruminococcus sp.]
MLLKSLELQGFKTFPDKTKLTFDHGITSVVGPNGSGKSNISDAIRWVLGEQSAKALRCSKMEDVVFNGTDKRKRQGYAEVTLTIDNSDRSLPYGGDDVAVTRRYYRSGESEYLINKASVRLKDIHELFMDTGLGRDGYSMIGQGKIDSIVASKSEDRREIFEEAAGISRYRYRKTEAERKLAHTEDNLLRLRDIVTELEDRVEPLRIQSEKAQKFLEYSGEKRGLEIALWLDTLNKSSAVLRDHEDKIAVAKAQYDEAEATLSSIATQTEEIYVKNGMLSSQIEQERAASSLFEAQIAEKRALISVSENDILHNKENIERIVGEIEKAESSTVDIKKVVETKIAEITALKEQIAAKQSDYNAISDELNHINNDASRSGDELQKLSAIIASLSQRLADVRVTDITSASTIDELEKRGKTLRASSEAKRTQRDDLISIKENYETKIKTAEQKIAALGNSIDGLQMKLNARAQKREELRRTAETLRLDAEEKSRRAKLLSDLSANFEGFYNSVKIVMKEAKRGAVGGICGPVTTLIKVPSEYNIAMEVALGAKMQHIVVNTDSDAKRAIEMLKKRDGGRATFLPITTIKPRTLDEKGLDDCYGYIGIASELCSTEPKYANILSNLLGRIVIAEDLNAASAIAKRYGYRFQVVTLDGQVINAGGSFTGGSRAKNSGLLSRESEIDSLRKQAAELSAKAKNAAEKLTDAEQQYAKVEADLLGTRADLTNTQNDKVRLNAEYNACLSELAAVSRDLEDIDRELSAGAEKITEAKAARELAQKDMIRFNADIESTELKIKTISGSRKELTQKREEYADKLQQLRLDILGFEKDVDTRKAEIESAESTGSDQQLRIRELENEKTDYENNNSEIENKITGYQAEIEALTEKQKQNAENIERLNNEKLELERDTVKLRQLERDKTSERELASNEFSRLEERKASKQKEFDDIISKLWEEYELTRREAEEQAIEIENLTEARSRLSSLKNKIKALGSVNTGAIEEYKEVSERYTFMKTQVDDVEKSKKEIENLIVNLTKQMKEVFVDSFGEINRNFTVTFKELFGGGEGHLELSDPENILTSGIDIIVHPPGKIVVHLEALSGGEKALVAIALYFAIMKVRPAPFCVMDEIEAALDEVNVDRFASYLRNLTSSTQFILITHRRGTMEEADVLYGVTMQDEGISKLLELRASEVAARLGMKAN